jgi:hypothetical protein
MILKPYFLLIETNDEAPTDDSSSSVSPRETPSFRAGRNSGCDSAATANKVQACHLPSREALSSSGLQAGVVDSTQPER